MMWASSISSSRSYRGTMFFIFMQCRWSMPLLLRTTGERDSELAVLTTPGARRRCAHAHLKCRMCDSSMSRWARRVYCWRKVKPVLPMAHTRASVTASSRRSSRARLCSSSPPSEEPTPHMSAGAQRTESSSGNCQHYTLTAGINVTVLKGGPQCVFKLTEFCFWHNRIG